MNKKKLRYGSTSAAITALVVAVVIVLNVLFTVLASKFLWYSDMTSNNLFTLSDEAKALLDTIDAPVKIIFAAEADKLENGTYSEYTPLVYMFVFNIMKYAAVCMCIFFTGHYTGSMFMKIISLPLFILLPVICAFGTPFLDNYSIADIKNVQEIYAYFSTKTSFVSIVLMLIYIVMGIVFLVKQRRQTDGDA